MSDWHFCSGIVSGVSILPVPLRPRLLSSIQGHTMVGCTKAQSHTPSSSYSSPEKGPELRPRPDMPPCSFPGACFPNPQEDNRAEDRRHHHTLSPFCSGAPSCCHIHRALGLACPCCTPTLGAVDTRANPSVAYSQT